MPSAPVCPELSQGVIATDLRCKNCDRSLTINGELMCPRCKRKVLATLGKERVFCPFCRKPKMLLAKNDKALCPKCRDDGTPIIKQEVGVVLIAEERVKELARRIMEELAREKAFELGIKKPISVGGRTETRYSRLTLKVEELIREESRRS